MCVGGFTNIYIFFLVKENIEKDIHRVSAEPEERNASKIVSTSVTTTSSTVLRRSSRTVNRDVSVEPFLQ